MFSKFVNKVLPIVIAIVLAAVAATLLGVNIANAGNGSYTCKKLWGCKSLDSNGNPIGRSLPVDSKIQIVETKVVTITIKGWWSTTTRTITLGRAQWSAFGGSWYNLTDDFK